MKIKTILKEISKNAVESIGIDPVDYESELPNFDVRKFLNGKIEGWGIFESRRGKVTNRFTIVMQCQWKENIGTLVENFTFKDGKTQERIWTVNMLSNNAFTATAADVIGEAKGEQYGNSMRMKYMLKMPVDGEIYDMKMEDWMFMIDEKTAMNRAKMKKSGLHVGDLTVFFRKVS